MKDKSPDYRVVLIQTVIIHARVSIVLKQLTFRLYRKNKKSVSKECGSFNRV